MKLKKMLRSPVFTIALFAIAGVLLLSTSIGATRALLTFFSDTYYARFVMKDIGITLNENGTAISTRDYSSENFDEKVTADNASSKDRLYWNAHNGALLGNMLAEDEDFVLGKTYPEALTVTNTSGSDNITISDGENDVETSEGIPEYVRVTVYKYWLKPQTDANGEFLKDEDGNILYEDKDVTLSPSLIDLHFTGDKNWIRDDKASSKKDSDSFKERNVYYYNKPLAVGETTTDLTDTLSIDASLGAHLSETKVEKDGKYTTYTYMYTYDNYRFCIEAQADAVQNQNAEQAILSAWGREVSIAGQDTPDDISDDILSLK